MSEVLVDKGLLEFALRIIETHQAIYYKQVPQPINDMSVLANWLDMEEEAMQALPELIAKGCMPQGYYKIRELVEAGQ